MLRIIASLFPDLICHGVNKQEKNQRNSRFSSHNHYDFCSRDSRQSLSNSRSTPHTRQIWYGEMKGFFSVFIVKKNEFRLLSHAALE